MSPLDIPLSIAMVALGLAGLCLHIGYKIGRRSRR